MSRTNCLLSTVPPVHSTLNCQSYCTYHKLRSTQIYRVSRTIVAPSFYIWPIQITQSYGGDCPANTVNYLTLQILLTKTYNRRFRTNKTDKYAGQCSGDPRLWLGAPLHRLAYLSVRFARHRRSYCLFDRICNVCTKLYIEKVNMRHCTANYTLHTVYYHIRPVMFHFSSSPFFLSFNGPVATSVCWVSGTKFIAQFS